MNIPPIDFKRLSNRYFVMRHGQSQANVARLIISSPDNGIDNFGLSPTGQEQARTAAATARDLLGPDTRIFSSDFLRTRETAQIVAGHIRSRHKVVLCKTLRERFFGDLEKGPDTAYELAWQADALKENLTEKKVEPIESVLQRGLACIREIEKQHQDETILLVSHGDTLQILLTFAKRVSPFRHRQLDPLQTAEIRPLYS